MTANKTTTAILISGRGTNMEALINAASDPEYPAKIELVVSSNPKAGGIEIARSKNIPVEVIDHKEFESREAFDNALNGALNNVNAELICNAGFMRLLTEKFVKDWHNRNLNIHPSLLPAFKGLNTHERAIASDVKISGCTVHFVRHEMDSGPIIAQAAVPVLPNDTPQTLKQRILKAEHKLYPKALKLLASGAIRVSGEHVQFSQEYEEQAALFSPFMT